METMQVIEKLCRAWRRLRSDHRGNVAIIFGLATLPIFGMVGAAIDYSRANASRTALQAALDSTGVMLSKEASQLTEDACKAKAVDYFRKNWDTMRAGHSYDGTAAIDAADVECKPINGKWTLKMKAKGSINTLMVRVLGSQYNKMDYASSTTLEWGANPIRIALALDTTGSMAQGTPSKISALRTAIAGDGGLIDLLKAQEKQVGDVYISVIPFAMRVSTDASNYTHDEYIDWTDWEAPPNNGTPNLVPGPLVGPGSNCPWSDGTNHFHCTTGPGNGSSSTSTVPSSGTYAGYICPSVSSSDDDPHNNRYYNGCYTSVADQAPPNNVQPQQQCTGSSCTCTGTVPVRPNCSCTGSGSGKVCKWSAYLHPWVPNARSTWADPTDATKACFIDRGLPLNPALAEPGPGTGPGNDQTLTAPVAGDSAAARASRYPADQPTAACPDKMRALKNDWAAMKTYINNLQPAGGTNQNIGLPWAWLSLKGGGPLGAIPAKNNNLIYDEYIILLSDGLNTGDRWYCDGTSDCPADKVAKLDARLAGTCANIKASGTQQQSAPVIYTVQVNTMVPADAESAVMKNCATRPTDQGTLKTTFFHLKQGGSIPDTFKQIAQEIVRTRITK
jgi:Flp pilus assembly protein TadG